MKQRRYTPQYPWVVFPDKNFAIYFPAKTGCFTMAHFLLKNSDIKHNVYTMSEITKLDVKKYFIVRNPLDRFCSLWRNKCRNAPVDKAGLNKVHKLVYGKTPHELIEYIIRNRNWHWTPQSTLLNNIDVTFIPLEHLNEWWDNNAYGNLVTINQTFGEVELDDSTVNLVHEFYADDFILYDLAKEQYCSLISTSL